MLQLPKDGEERALLTNQVFNFEGVWGLRIGKNNEREVRKSERGRRERGRRRERHRERHTEKERLIKRRIKGWSAHISSGKRQKPPRNLGAVSFCFIRCLLFLLMASCRCS